MALIKYTPNKMVTPAVKPAPATGMSRPMTAQTPQQAGDNNDEAPAPFGYDSWDSFYASLYGGGGRSGGGTFTGETKPQRLAREAAARGAVNQANYIRDQISGLGAEYDRLIGQVPAAFAPGRAAAESAYQTALAALGGRRTEAEGLTRTSQEALQSYLASNPSRAFASLPAAQAPTLNPNVIARFAAATGVTAPSIAQAAAEESAMLQSNAAGFDRLAQLLQASEQRANQSRLTEYELLKAVQDAQLRTQYGAGATALETQRQAALNQIAAQEAAETYRLNQARAAREQAFKDALASLYGTGNVAYAPGLTGQIPDLSGVDFAALGRLMGGR